LQASDDKSPDAFRTISEVAESMELPQHVLRFWETRFPQIKPLKRGGGRRYYRPDDVELLKTIKRLLYDQGYTIKGVQKLHREQGMKRLLAGGGEVIAEPGDEALFEPSDRPNLSSDSRRRLSEALEDLQAAKTRLDGLLGGG